MNVAPYGPWAVVTGASDGIGGAIAEELAATGLSLVLVGRRAEILAELATSWQQKYGVGVQPLPADLVRPDAMKEIARATSFLDVGLVVLAAGYGSIGEFAGATPACCGPPGCVPLPGRYGSGSCTASAGG